MQNVQLLIGGTVPYYAPESSSTLLSRLNGLSNRLHASNSYRISVVKTEDEFDPNCIRTTYTKVIYKV